MSWNGKAVVVSVACVMGAGAGVLYVYQRWFIERMFERLPGGPFSELLVDAGAVGIGLVLVHGFVWWGADVGRQMGGKRVWGWTGGCFAGGGVVLLLWLWPTERCRGVFEVLPIWILVVGWWFSGDSSSTGRFRTWSEYVTAGLVLVLYSLSVFPLLPWQLGGGRPVAAAVATVDGVFTGEVTRWRSGDWVFPRDETRGLWIPSSAQRVDAMGAARAEPADGGQEDAEQAEGAEPSRQVLLLDPAPRWVASGAWDRREERLLLVDALQEEIFSYPVRGGGEGGAVQVGNGQTVHGSVLRRVGEGYLLEREEGELLRLTQEFKVWGAVDLKAGSWGHPRRIGGLYQWTSVVGNELLALVEFEERQGEEGATRWGAGFVRIDLNEPEAFEVLREVARERSAWFGMNLVSAWGRWGYFLDPDRGELIEVDFRSERSELRVLATITARAPSPRTQRVLESVQAMEAASFTAGVYAAGNGRVWLLEREAQDGATSWRLDAVDRATGERHRSGRVVSEAAWLTVVPGTRRWAVIEKGAVADLGRHEPPISRAVLVVPAELAAVERSAAEGAVR